MKLSASLKLKKITSNLKSRSLENLYLKSKSYDNLQEDGASKEIKLQFMGASAVGKTALILKGLGGRFPEDYEPTISESYQMQFSTDDMTFSFAMNDLGTSFSEGMRDLHIKESDCFIVVYSITSKTSFVEAREIVEKIQQVKHTRRVPILLVGNKSDLGGGGGKEAREGVGERRGGEEKVRENEEEKRGEEVRERGGEKVKKVKAKGGKDKFGKKSNKGTLLEDGDDRYEYRNEDRDIRFGDGERNGDRSGDRNEDKFVDKVVPVSNSISKNGNEDLGERSVMEQEGLTLAKQFGCGFIEVSAKSGENVREMFESVVEVNNVVNMLRSTKSGEEDTNPIVSYNNEKCILQ